MSFPHLGQTKYDFAIVLLSWYINLLTHHLSIFTFSDPHLKEYPGVAPRAFNGLYEIIEQNKDKFETKVRVPIMSIRQLLFDYIESQIS